MSVNLEVLKRLTQSVHNRTAPWSVRAIALDIKQADAIIAALERGIEERADLLNKLMLAEQRAERVRLHAVRLVGRIDEFENCLQDRGITQAPCHGIPLVGVFNVRDVLRTALAPAPESSDDR